MLYLSGWGKIAAFRFRRLRDPGRDELREVWAEPACPSITLENRAASAPRRKFTFCVADDRRFSTNAAVEKIEVTHFDVFFNTKAIIFIKTGGQRILTRSLYGE